MTFLSILSGFRVNNSGWYILRWIAFRIAQIFTGNALLIEQKLKSCSPEYIATGFRFVFSPLAAKSIEGSLMQPESNNLQLFAVWAPSYRISQLAAPPNSFLCGKHEFTPLYLVKKSAHTLPWITYKRLKFSLQRHCQDLHTHTMNFVHCYI